MCDILRRRFDVRDAALDWFRSYFTHRTQVIAIGSSVSTLQHHVAGVPQGSVFGPRAFIAYPEDVVDILSGHGGAHHLYTDDIQGTKHDKPIEQCQHSDPWTGKLCRVGRWMVGAAQNGFS